MNCWQCKYFKFSTNDKPCNSCNEKSNFRLWFLKEEKTDDSNG